MSFVGSIVGTQGEQVEVAFDIDKTAAGGNRYGFAPATGNLMYCMPQKGTKTALYIGNGDEAQGIATGCIRTNGSTCEGTGSPEKKSFRSEHGKGMDLYPQRMGLDGGETGKITFEDETGTTIESNGGLVLMAKEGIRLESMTGIAMQGMSDIMALYSEGASSLCVNGSVDMLGRLAGISASKYTGYPPYDDAPKEGEFDWDGFTRNLAIGLGVVAVCAIGAAISIATLGAGSILAGAFIGAGIGALSTTAMKAGEEIATGNVRSAKEAFRDVGISAASGFVTGAFGAKFPGAHRLAEGVVDTAVSAGERLAYAVFDDSMSWDEKWAYAFDPGQMVADFVTGVVIGEILDGIMAATQNKLRSIFANNDAAMREDEIPSIGKAASKVKPFVNLIQVFRSKLEFISISDLLREVIEETGYVKELEAEGTDEAEARIENIDELLSKVVSYEESEEHPTLSGFLEEVALVADIDSLDESDNRVLLMIMLY